VIHEVFIAIESCHFVGVEVLESHFLLITLMKDKYPLHNIK